MTSYKNTGQARFIRTYSYPSNVCMYMCMYSSCTVIVLKLINSAYFALCIIYVLTINPVMILNMVPLTRIDVR